MPAEVVFDREELTSPAADRLISALNAELAAAYPQPGATHWGLNRDEVAPGEGAFIVGRWAGSPVACGAVRCLRDAKHVRELGENVAEVKRMYVAPEFRGGGIGRRLLQRLEDEARELGAHRLVLETGVRQAAALSLYERHGFNRIPLYGEYAASPDTSVCLSKAI